jgi:hypothetical protein
MINFVEAILAFFEKKEKKITRLLLFTLKSVSSFKIFFGGLRGDGQFIYLFSAPSC